ncbi:helix-turn-helix domain-containing protein [Klebsiella variicola]|uniref:helix-turn-helix domain-containing protein n=1 Tax=Klebsiella variicola TaxID=244366 RepID=UPI00396CA3C7
MHLVESSFSKRLTRNEAAAHLGVTPQTLANWAHTGKVKIPFHKVGRKVIYFTSDLDAYLDSTRRTQTL